MPKTVVFFVSNQNKHSLLLKVFLGMVPSIQQAFTTNIRVPSNIGKRFNNLFFFIANRIVTNSLPCSGYAQYLRLVYSMLKLELGLQLCVQGHSEKFYIIFGLNLVLKSNNICIIRRFQRLSNCVRRTQFGTHLFRLKLEVFC